ncbi:hypothetical protein UA08_03529 [Talaromyces atroroseus]|uniref:DUF1308 domain-containing protein n=1 Tax=Talaromyces atroroseus TaxID=1441469 RepID=A0A225B1V2_TALAT|nr:hypothetical protein UA08_03529 [Talaromyces atroroseus]OKL60795.1 hypothetical protein UA08_03529 [Talaromyces atroroseus]
MTNDTRNDEAETPAKLSAPALSSRLIHQCRLLLAEIDVFQNAVASRFRKHQQQQHLVELRLLRSSVATELKILERLSGDANALMEERHAKRQKGEDDDDDDFEMKEGRILHTLRSSNLSFHVAVWTIAKQYCEGVVAFSKRFYGVGHGQQQQQDDEMSDKEGKHNKAVSKDKRKGVFVDIVYRNGEEWLKVLTLSESRLLFEMAEKGWGMDDEYDDYDDGDLQDIQKRTILQNSSKMVPTGGYLEDDFEDDDDQLEMIKMAADMIKVARATRVRYKNPRVRIIAPRLEEGKIPEVDRILNIVRGYGVAIECGTKVPDVFNEETNDQRDPHSITESDLPISTMLPNPFKEFTDTINVDCTLLLAVVSELSHKRHITPSPKYHRAILRQIEVENELPLLPAELWPAMTNRKLVCTEEAVTRMKEIVGTIGTESEKLRTAIFLGEGDMEGLETDTLLSKFQQLSDHPIPNQLQIPIQVVDAHAEIDAALQQNKFPPVFHKVTEFLTDINRSVFLYGWATGIVTITSNNTVVRQIENTIERNRGDDDAMEGPKTWVCDTARSLIGKEKNRKP